LFSTHNIAEAERYGRRLLVIADGEALFDGPPRDLHEAVVAGAEDGGEETIASFEHAFVSFLRQRGH
jgi:ABC-type multidrug transport system ATPase subunit